MNQFNYRGKVAVAPDDHRVITNDIRMIDVGLDCRAMPEDIDEPRCPRCGNIMPLDKKCDCSSEDL